MLEGEADSQTTPAARRGRHGKANRTGERPTSHETRRVRRCAVYTRKSSDEGLEQSFNSLDAQREACEAYIASQKHEGWKLVPTAYDDGGLSGGTMNRPALQRLLEDITAGHLDVIVVYKVDRLTRSLADFAKLTDLLDGAGACFVSVTQAFNTSTSMGRLTLNVLLSFAQFEREVAGERIRDKIAASKKRGMWMGGMPPLGYDVRDKQLVVNQAEAQTVQTIFESYLRLGTVAQLKACMDAQGVVSKVRTIKGKTTGSITISRNGYHTILKCPLYRGMIHHKGQHYPGNHQAIIDQEIWDAVQAQLAANASTAASATSAQQSHLLTGLIFDEDGERLSPSHSTKRIKSARSQSGCTRRYTYYVSASLVRGKPIAVKQGNAGLRLSATELDALVMQSLKAHLRNREWVGSIASDALPVQERKHLMICCTTLSKQLNDHQARGILERVIIQQDALTIIINRQTLTQQLGTDADALSHEPIRVTQASGILQRGRSSKLVVGSVVVDDPCINQELVDQLKIAYRWWQMIVATKALSITALAATERVDASEVSRTITLACIDPQIIRMILHGTQPPSLTLDALRRARPLPANWKEQRQLLLG